MLIQQTKNTISGKDFLPYAASGNSLTSNIRYFNQLTNIFLYFFKYFIKNYKVLRYPPSTGKFIPLIYPAKPDAKNVIV